MPGEVTAALPSLGALAEADEWEQDGASPGQGGLWAGAPAGHLTANITAALPGLAALVAEDEEATAGMDLTLPAGRVLEHHPQQQQQQQAHASPAPAAAAASPAPAAVQASPAAVGAPQNRQVHPALAVAGDEDEGAAAMEPTLALAGGAAAEAAARLSGGSDELGQGREVGAQLSKWGFAPGADDTMNIDLELHGGWVGRACLVYSLGRQGGTGCVARLAGCPGGAPRPCGLLLLPFHGREAGDQRRRDSRVPAPPPLTPLAGASRRPHDHGRPDLQPPVLRQHHRRQRAAARARLPGWRRRPHRRHRRFAAGRQPPGGGRRRGVRRQGCQLGHGGTPRALPAAVVGPPRRGSGADRGRSGGDRPELGGPRLFAALHACGACSQRRPLRPPRPGAQPRCERQQPQHAGDAAGERGGGGRAARQRRQPPLLHAGRHGAPAGRRRRRAARPAGGGAAHRRLGRGRSAPPRAAAARGARVWRPPRAPPLQRRSM
jgi:hypothetical protein